ncbi:sensor domain-containing diguanylate cyclase [Alteromonas facilis]|uniref:GGDEF domain-containing protein n=1 Tax=Alteromonas facilis TaxID=2048004 RepID=UPI000C282B34|nr:diguanylate cyclase [Alteromonas facilis]
MRKVVIKSVVLTVSLFAVIFCLSLPAFANTDSSLSDLKMRLEGVQDRAQQVDMLLLAESNSHNWPVIDQGRYHMMLAERQERLNQLEASWKSYTQAITLLESISPTSELVKSYLERSYVTYLQTNDINQYCPDRVIAVELARQVTDPEILVKALTQHAFCFRNSDEFSTGLALLDEALAEANTHQLGYAPTAMIYNATALLYRDNELHQQAYLHLANAYEQWLAVEDWPDVFNMLHGLVGEAIELERFDDAREHAQEMYALAEKLPQYADFLFFAHFNLARVALREGEVEEAITLYQKAIAEQDNTSEKYFVRVSYIYLARAFARNGQLEEAAKAAAQYITLSPSADLEHPMILEANAFIAATEGETKTAVANLMLRIEQEHKEKLDLINRQTVLSSLDHDATITSYKNKLLEQEINIQQLELKRQESEQHIANLSMLFIALLALVVTVIALFLFQSRRLFKHKANTDGLTGISNRRHILEQSLKAIEQASRQQQPLSLIIFDIDNFKRINDTHGHQLGDVVIRSAARQAQHLLRNDCQLGRIGGEEFLVLMPHIALEEAATIAERLRSNIAEKVFHLESSRLTFSISLGVACTEQQGYSLDALVKAADDALYEAKNAGRNAVKMANH